MRPRPKKRASRRFGVVKVSVDLRSREMRRAIAFAEGLKRKVATDGDVETWATFALMRELARAVGGLRSKELPPAESDAITKRARRELRASKVRA